MPKYTFTPKEPIAKLPLSARKEIRDNYESKREDLEAKVSEVLGVKFKFNFNPNEIWAYNQDDGQNPGYTLAGYADGFVSAIESFAKTYGEEGIKDFNSAVSKSELSVNVNEVGKDAPTITCNIKDGVCQILFHHEKLGYNASYLSHVEILAAVDAVPHSGMNLEAKHSIAEKWEPEYEELTEQIGAILNIPDIKLDPNFEENYAKLEAGKKDDKDWMRNFGTTTFNYFSDGLKSQLEYKGVKDDDLVQEGIAEALEKKLIKMRIVEKLKEGDYYNGVTFEDGILYLETTVEKWYYNVGDTASKIIDQL